MTHSIILKSTPEEKEIHALQKGIQRKQKQLQMITEKTELLKMELEEIQNQYNARIGWLYIKDNKLDLEIIKYKTILDFVESGLSLDEATMQVENSFYHELLESETKEEFMSGEYTFTQIKQKAEKSSSDIKKLWKKLIVRFHPDLVTDTAEKQKREELIKKINRAYKEEDIETLKILESHMYFETKMQNKKSDLEKQLVMIENAIIQVQMQYKLLKQSQWFQWKIRAKKAKTEKKDIFAELERTLLDDIGRKIDLLHSIKEKLTKQKATQTT